MEETAALSEVHKRVLCILGRGLELWVQIRCLSKNTKKTLALFFLSLFPFYFLFLCRLIDLLLPLLTIATKVTSGRKVKVKQQNKNFISFMTRAVFHCMYRLYNLPVQEHEFR